MLIILLIIVVILFISCPISIDFVNVNCLTIHIAIIKTLKLLNRPNNKENRKYIIDTCSDGKNFNIEFCKYCRTYDRLIDIAVLSVLLYEYITFKEITMKENDI